MSTSFGGWTIHLQAAIQYDPQGYDQPAAIYNVPAVVYGGDPYEAQWVTLDCEVTQVNASLGGRIEQIPGMRASLGTLTATLLDPDRELDPTASPYKLLTKPNVPVRLTATSPGGTVTPLWTGVADSWEHDYVTGSGELKASDRISLLTGIDLSNVKRPAETSKARYQAALAMVPAEIPFVFEGLNANLSAATLSGDLWSAMVAETSEAEQSIVWFDQRGWFRRRDTTGLPTPIKASDCDDGLVEIVYTRLGSSWDDDDLTNLVICERLNIGDVKRTFQRGITDSVNEFGAHSLTKTDLALLDDVALDAWARRVLDLRAYPTAKATNLGITLQNNFPWTVRTVPTVATLEIGDVLDIHLTSKGEQERWLGAVAGLSHSISTTAWDVAVELVDGFRFAQNAGYDHAQSVYDVTQYGRVPGIAPVEVFA